jgi:hypothetical protein
MIVIDPVTLMRSPGPVILRAPSCTIERLTMRRGLEGRRGYVYVLATVIGLGELRWELIEPEAKTQTDFANPQEAVAWVKTHYPLLDSDVEEAAEELAREDAERARARAARASAGGAA